jgi:coiled-coil and C2 domain-containing protein 1
MIYVRFQVSILRGINLPVPSGYASKSLETYVTIEFPFPPETSQTARTRYAVGSVNAEYGDSTHRFTITRSQTRLRRLMNRKELRLAIYYKVGFLRNDRQLGLATLKLADLEQLANIHESVDVYDCDDKRKVEGKLEVRIRIKEALGPVKASEVSTQHWLVINRFEDTVKSR